MRRVDASLVFGVVSAPCNGEVDVSRTDETGRCAALRLRGRPRQPRLGLPRPTRVLRAARGALAILSVLAVLCTAQPANARHRHYRDEGDGVPGDFSYYLLTLSWSPAFCLESPGADECHGPRRYGFIVHGLWPQNESGPVQHSPENCNVHREVPQAVVRSMAEVMPSRRLVYHEWSTHGTCSGLDPRDYFELVRRAYASLAIPELAGRGGSIERSTDAITRAFLQSNPRLPQDAIITTCSRQGAPRLREVRLCLSRDLEPRHCSVDVQRSACRSATVLVPPIR